MAPRLALALLGCAAAFGCHGEEPAGPSASGADAATAAPAPPSEPLEARLRRCAVTDEGFARRVLYTWTTAEQAERLRRDLVLLTASVWSPPGPTPFNLALLAEVRTGSRAHEVARLLLEHEALAGRRYAWSCPFATAVPLGERSYGHALVRIELRPAAWIGRFEAGVREAPIVFTDLEGDPVDEAVVLSHPERIAAIYHVRTRAREPFREYVVCNESMVARWSLGTPEIEAELAEETALLHDLEARAASLLAGAPEPTASWAGLSPGAPLRDLWDASIAFDSPRHRPTAEALRAMAAALAEHDPGGPPFAHVPTARRQRRDPAPRQ